MRAQIEAVVALVLSFLSVMMAVTHPAAGNYSSSNSTEADLEMDMVSRSYSITCCKNGKPQPDPEIAEYVLEWSEEFMGKTGFNSSCNRFIGYYSMPMDIFVGHRRGLGVRCKCPEDNLDRNCRFVPQCHNGGYRSFSINLRCVCPGAHFGELCEKYCHRGKLIKIENVDVCLCGLNYQGEQCDRIKCMNGGRPIENRCMCPSSYYGLHCEIPLKNNLIRYGNRHKSSPVISPDSGSILMLLLFVGLAFLMFFLMKRKTQLIARRRTAARDLYYGQFAADASRDLPLRDPPPYTVCSNPCFADGSSGNQLPPLPSYQDALKLPASGQAAAADPELVVATAESADTSGMPEHSQTEECTAEEVFSEMQPTDSESQQNAAEENSVSEERERQHLNSAHT